VDDEEEENEKHERSQNGYRRWNAPYPVVQSPLDCQKGAIFNWNTTYPKASRGSARQT